jgi:hypothetical protein
VDQPLIQFLVELDDFYFGGGGREDGLHPELTVIGSVFLGGQDLAQEIFSVVRIFLFLLFFGLGAFGRAAYQHGG